MVHDCFQIFLQFLYLQLFYINYSFLFYFDVCVTTVCFNVTFRQCVLKNLDFYWRKISVLFISYCDVVFTWSLTSDSKILWRSLNLRRVFVLLQVNFNLWKPWEDAMMRIETLLQQKECFWQKLKCLCSISNSNRKLLTNTDYNYYWNVVK